MDKEQQIHEMTIDFMRTQHDRHGSVKSYVEHYLSTYAEIKKLMAQSENLTKQ